MAGRGGRINAADSRRGGTTAEAKEKFLEGLSLGMTVKNALAHCGRTSLSTYHDWKQADEDFRQRAYSLIDRNKNGSSADEGRKQVPDFETFSREYLFQPLDWHQQQWVDVLEGREPRDLHPAEQWTAGRQNRVLINVPPEHGKSTTLTENYVTWKIVSNPNIRIIVVSKNKKMAQAFLYAVKARLTGPRYRQLQIDFGPAGGYMATADQWSADTIYLGEKDDGEKDPTLQALGMQGHIYGARADLVICDDVATLSNAHDYESQAQWLTQEVLTRLGRMGILLVVGTRVAPQDLYKHLVATFPGVWSHLAQPAILEDHDDLSKVRTLWPERWDHVEQCRVPQWDAESMHIRRSEVLPSTWAMAYMQADLQQDAIFPEAAVKAALNRQRMQGLMKQGAPGHRPEGMTGCYVLCTMDPALSGFTAAVTLALDPVTGKRWVLDLHNEAGMTPASIRNHIYAWTEKYQPREWRIEKNAMQGMLTQDEELRQFLSARACRLVEHFTDKGKWDGDYGVAGMAPLFLAGLDPVEGKPNGKSLIDIPYNKVTGGGAAADALVQQLVSFAPSPPGVRARPGTTDLVMALWFADIRARELVNGRDGRADFLPNPYLSRAAAKRRVIVNLDEHLQWMEDQARIAV